MAVRMFEKAVLNIKEVHDVGLFGAMIDSRLFALFGSSPFYFVMLPFVGLLLLVLATIQGYHLFKASNKHIDQWLGFLSLSVGAACANVSLTGAVIAKILGVSFLAGPWVFLGGMILACLHQSVMLGLNIYRVFESPPGSLQRMHYLQTVFNNAFNLILSLAIIGTIVFVLITPAAPAVGSLCAISVVSLIILNGLWRVTPYSWKQFIKNHLNLGKETAIEQQSTSSLNNLQHIGAINTHEQQAHHSRLFTQPDYSARVRVMDVPAASAYLHKMITNKHAALVDGSIALGEKNKQKIAVLSELKLVLDGTRSIEKNELLKKHPLAFQSFWTEKGEVEQLFDAVILVCAKRKELDSSEVNTIDLSPSL